MDVTQSEPHASRGPAMAGVQNGIVYGKQRPAADIAAVALLLTGFGAIAYALRVFTGNWIGILLPLGFLIAAWASLRVEVREIELRRDVLLVRTFFREYPIPRDHVTNVALTPQGAAIDVLNGRRYLITPPGADAEEIAVTLSEWLRGAGIENSKSS